MNNTSFKIFTLCADTLVTEAFKSIILASGYEHFPLKDFSSMNDLELSNRHGLILIDENIIVNGRKENYLKFFKNYTDSLPVLVAVSDSDKEFLKRDIFTYVTKPINISTLQQLAEPYRDNFADEGLNLIQLDDHSYNINSRTLVLADGKNVRFTNFEGGLMLIFIKNFSKTLTTKFLLENILGYSSGADSNTLKTHIWRLRKKLNYDNFQFDIVNTKEGYVFKKY